MEGERSAAAAAMLGMPGFVVLAVSDFDGELEQAIEWAEVAGCLGRAHPELGLSGLPRSWTDDPDRSASERLPGDHLVWFLLELVQQLDRSVLHGPAPECPGRVGPRTTRTCCSRC